MRCLNVLIVAVSALVSYAVASDSINVVARWRDDKFRVLKHFWKNTGFSPLGDDGQSRRDYLLSQDEKMNLALIGSVPNNGITHVRVHWILDLVTVKKINGDGPIFDYQHLDEFVDWLHRHGLIPTFELMGNPSGHFRNFKQQSQEWYSLIREILSRYIDKYGGVYLRQWRFELMNEPDLKMYNFFNFTLPDYLEYFRLNEKAVGKVQGPAGLFHVNKTSHPLCWGLLQYCNLNPCNLDLLTYHRKGEGGASTILRHGLDLIGTIKQNFPNLTNLAFGNDEADISKGWHEPKEWRADSRYASFVVQVIVGHINEMYVVDSVPFEVLSNDNAFMNYHPYYFTQRTLLTRFQMNNTNPPHVQFIKKPVYSVMGLLSLIGTYLLDIEYHPTSNGFSYVLTGEKHRVYFLGVLTNDSITEETYQIKTLSLTIKLELPDSDDERVAVVYALNDVINNPNQVWKSSGSSDFPDNSLRRKMRLSEDFKMVQVETVNPKQGELSISLPSIVSPSVVAINVCESKYKEPGSVENLHFMKVNDNEVLLLWTDEYVDSKCLLTYVVEFRSRKSGIFKRINKEGSIFLSYHFDGFIDGVEESVLGEYRVAGVDYFGRYGDYSNILEISSI